MSLRFNLGLLAAILLNGAVLGDDSTSSDALAGHDGERNAPSRGGDAVRNSEGRARNGDKLVVLDSARTTPSETVRKSVSVMRRMSGQSSLRNRNEVRNDHVGVEDKHGMKLPRARRPATSRHSEGGLTSKSPKEFVGVLDRKKEFENMVSGIIAEEAEGQMGYVDNLGREYDECPYKDYGYDCVDGSDEPGAGDPPGSSSPPEQKNNSTSGTASSSNQSAASSSVGEQNSVTGNKDEGNTSNGEAPKNGQEKERDTDKEKEDANNDKAPKDEGKEKKKEEDGKEKGEKQLEQKSNENSDGQETNSSSEDAENKKVPPSGNSAFLCGSYSSVLLVAVVCVCACAC
ncbi:hypothetical protein ERJ75_000077300 [Trypanosoma vivax]|nr:hypothetical protein ERJ75_000077300 [Trypanosoma vivax]